MPADSALVRTSECAPVPISDESARCAFAVEAQNLQKAAALGAGGQKPVEKIPETHLSDDESLEVPPLFSTNGSDRQPQPAAESPPPESPATPVKASVTDVWKDEIQPSGVQQRAWGDCFFMAGLASLASNDRGRELIRNMIQDNGNGTYTVTFPGDKSHPVTVDAQDIDRVSDAGASWARVMEAALLCYNGIENPLRSPITFQLMPIGSKVMTGHEALRLLTNESVSTDATGKFIDLTGWRAVLGTNTKDQVAAHLTEATQNGDFMTAVVGGGGILPTVAGSNEPGALPLNHVYTVLSYNPEDQTVIIRNPHGRNSRLRDADLALAENIEILDNDGRMKMSLDTFMKTFSGVNFSGASSTERLFEEVPGKSLEVVGDVAEIVFDAVTFDTDELKKDVSELKDDAMAVLHDTTAYIWDRIHRPMLKGADYVYGRLDDIQEIGESGYELCKDIVNGDFSEVPDDLADLALETGEAVVDAIGDGISFVGGILGL